MFVFRLGFPHVYVEAIGRLAVPNISRDSVQTLIGTSGAIQYPGDNSRQTHGNLSLSCLVACVYWDTC